MNCKSCNTKLFGDYCHHCGQAIQKKRISYGYLMSQFLGAFINYDTGIIKTMKLLFLKPAYVFNEYIKGNSVAFYSPFKLFFLGITIKFLSATIFSHELEAGDFNKLRLLTENQYFHIFIGLLFLPYRGKIFSLFSKNKYNTSEAIILMLYIHGFFSIIDSFFIIADYFIKPYIVFPIFPITFYFASKLLTLYWFKKILKISIFRSMLLIIITYILPIILATVLLIFLKDYL